VTGRVLLAALALAVAALVECHPQPRACRMADRRVACAPAAGDGACATCLKGSCCTESLEWFNGSDGASVVACINAHCPGACQRRSDGLPPRR